MYDGLDRVPIKNMNFKQLRERVQILQDRYDALLRRFPELYATQSGDKIDWANIVTPLFRALVNNFQVKASLNSENTIEIFARPENGFAPLSPDADAEELDHSLIYRYENGRSTEYWYWNGNEWKFSTGGFSSMFSQTPAGFQMDGTLELKTDTMGRVTVSDSFIKMYPEQKITDPDTGELLGSMPGYIPKLQIGYDDNSENKNPVIILGQGSSESVTDSVCYPLRYGQAIVHKTAAGLIFGAVGDSGIARWLELRAQSLADDQRRPGLYYSYEEEVVNDNGETVKEVKTVRIDDKLT